MKIYIQGTALDYMYFNIFYILNLIYDFFQCLKQSMFKNILNKI